MAEGIEALNSIFEKYAGKKVQEASYRDPTIKALERDLKNEGYTLRAFFNGDGLCSAGYQEDRVNVDVGPEEMGSTIRIGIDFTLG